MHLGNEPVDQLPFVQQCIGDDIGELLNAQILMVLIGERPGLSSPDSFLLLRTLLKLDEGPYVINCLLRKSESEIQLSFRARITHRACHYLRL